MPVNFKTGRLPEVFTARTMKSAVAFAKAVVPLGTPPATSDWYTAVESQVPGNNWSMDGNDQYGDCTCADCSHQVMQITANTGTIIIPTAAQTLQLYTDITGFNPNNPSTDNGAVIDDVCKYLVSTGYLGYFVDSYASIDPANIDHVKWAVHLFGAVKLGVTLPDSAETQFNNNQPWDVVQGSKIDGGHDICIVGYDTTGFYIVTWGKRILMTPAFFSTYVDEVKVCLYKDWTSTGNAPSAFDYTTLKSDLAQLN